MKPCIPLGEALASSAASAAFEYRVISLPRGVERRARMEAQLEALQLTPRTRFAPGVEGATLEGDATARAFVRGMRARRNKAFGYNELGCFLAHRGVWRELAEDAACDWYVVLEDDAVLTPALNAVVESLVAKRDGDFVRLHSTRGVINEFLPVREIVAGHHLLLNCGRLPPFLIFGNGSARARRVIKCTEWSAVAYLVSKRAAKVFLNHSKRIHGTADTQMPRFWETGFPPLLVSPDAAQHTWSRESMRGDSKNPILTAKRRKADLLRKASCTWFRALDSRRAYAGFRALRRTYGEPSLTLTPPEGAAE